MGLRCTRGGTLLRRRAKESVGSMRCCKLCTLVCWRNVPRRPVHEGFLQAVEPARQPIASPKPAYRRGLHQGVSDVTLQVRAALQCPPSPHTHPAPTLPRVGYVGYGRAPTRPSEHADTPGARDRHVQYQCRTLRAAVPHVRWEQRADSDTRRRQYTTPKADRETCMGAKYTGTNHRAATPARQHRGPSHPVSRA